MISRVQGILVHRDLHRAEVATAGGVVYELEIPMSVGKRLPREGEEVEMRTVHVVREDAHTLYGFLEPGEREIFSRLLAASGVGGRMALAMLSTFSYRRLARALVEKDVTALSQVSGIGRKTAERLSLELADRVRDLAVDPAPGREGKAGAPATEEAVQALMALGYSFEAADRAVRRAVEQDDPESTDELIRKALAQA